MILTARIDARRRPSAKGREPWEKTKCPSTAGGLQQTVPTPVSWCLVKGRLAWDYNHWKRYTFSKKGILWYFFGKRYPAILFQKERYTVILFFKKGIPSYFFLKRYTVILFFQKRYTWYFFRKKVSNSTKLGNIFSFFLFAVLISNCTWIKQAKVCPRSAQGRTYQLVWLADSKVLHTCILQKMHESITYLIHFLGTIVSYVVLFVRPKCFFLGLNHIKTCTTVVPKQSKGTVTDLDSGLGK